MESTETTHMTVLEIAGVLARLSRGERAQVAGFEVERLSDGAYRVGEYKSPPVSRSIKAGAPVMRTAEHIAKRR